MSEIKNSTKMSPICILPLRWNINEQTILTLTENCGNSPILSGPGLLATLIGVRFLSHGTCSVDLTNRSKHDAEGFEVLGERRERDALERRSSRRMRVFARWAADQRLWLQRARRNTHWCSPPTWARNPSSLSTQRISNWVSLNTVSKK